MIHSIILSIIANSFILFIYKLIKGLGVRKNYKKISNYIILIITIIIIAVFNYLAYQIGCVTK